MNKFEHSASLDVVLHYMLYSNICAERADETCMLSPPSNMTSMIIHFKFSRREEKQV